ncbi:MAG TPA: hypothetical protein PKD92_08905 [Novosphingobium sp.]|nr:hypothetical protein [Novosphingobium sp.]HMP56675.1 hypothetical protein [Novosphingobium sp.]
MRKSALILAAAAAVLAAPAVSAKQPRLTGEEKLAKLLEGREAGQPVSCINLSAANETRVIDKTAIAYKVGSTWYVNRPRDARSLDSDDVLVTRTHSNQLCRLDTVRLHDRNGLWFSGFVGLEDFVPYRKVAAR